MHQKLLPSPRPNFGKYIKQPLHKRNYIKNKMF